MDVYTLLSRHGLLLARLFPQILLQFKGFRIEVLFGSAISAQFGKGGLQGLRFKLLGFRISVRPGIRPVAKGFRILFRD